MRHLVKGDYRGASPPFASVQKPFIPWRQNPWRTFPWAAAVALIGLAAGAAAQNGDGSPGEKPLSAQEITEIVRKARTLLRDVTPRSGPPSIPYAHPPDQPCQKMEVGEGIVQWGNLFTPGETVALVNPAPPPKTEDDRYDDTRPRYLCLFAWKDGQWTFRQFLGNVYNLTVHHRKDRPAAFLQGSCRTGRYEGDYLSWYYDPARKRLVPTNFEDWGPFYLVGNYLVLGRGFERLHHDNTHSIYAYKNGRKGELIADLHENDRGNFDFECRNPKSGQREVWYFNPEDEEGDRLSVAMENGPRKNGAHAGDRRNAEFTVQLTQTGDGWSPTDFFCFLSGLDPALLDDKWLDESPKRSAPKRLPVKVTGDPMIVARFR